MNDNKALFKFNNGNGALLCSKCRVIIREGKDYTPNDLAMLNGDIPSVPQYCDKCKKDTDVIECPICIAGRNSKDHGGNEMCFHCDTCGFVECATFYPDADSPIQDILDMIRIRLINFRDRRK